LTLSPSEIEEYIDKMDLENKQMKEQLAKLCWYMRGGLEYDTAYMLSPDDRGILAELIKENIENTKNAKMPLL
jgi:hypothetical protein